MKKYLTLLVVCILFISGTLCVRAGTIPGESTGGGGGGSGGTPNEHPPYSTFTPKVTLIHNVNAMAAQNPSNENDAVYYIPTLSDLPFSMKDYVQTRADKSFAYVYDGYFDTEAKLTQGVEVVGGSDRVSYSSQAASTGNVSSPALKSIGYDLLLVDDNYVVNKSGNDIRYINQSTVAGTTALTAEQAVMDIYKALGKFEYKVDVAFMKDKNWNTNSSPILSELSVLTSQNGTSGLNINQSYAAVAVSRTKASLYWSRFLKDGVTSGVDKNIGNGSLSVHTQLTCNQGDYISYMEFLKTLVALMNLYGEEALDDTSYQLCMRNYAQSLGRVSQRSEDERKIVYYLVAKGILDPEKLDSIDLDGNVYLLSEYNSQTCPIPGNSIIDILERVSDKERRLELDVSEPVMDSELARSGYGVSNFYINPDIHTYSEQLTDFSTYYDYLIEKTEENTYRAKIKVTESSAAPSEETKGSKAQYDAVNNMRIVIDGEEVVPLPITATSSQLNQARTGTLFVDEGRVGLYVYYGLEKHDGKTYYHFKISPDYAKNASLAFKYSKQPQGEVLVKDAGTFTLPESDKGGVYNHKSDSGYEHSTFKQSNYIDTYIDYESKVTSSLSNDLTTITFYIDQKKLTRNILSQYSNDTDSIYDWTSILTSKDEVKYDRLIDVLKSEAPNKKSNFTKMIIQESTAQQGNNFARVQIITRNVSGVKSSRFFTNRNGSEDYYCQGYYRADDNSLMVSYNYLRQKNLVTAISEVSDGVYVLTVGKYSTNVTIYTGKGDSHDGQYLIVGDTLYPHISETLLVKADGDTYINYRACLGWGGEFAFISEGNTATVVNYGQYMLNDTTLKQTANAVTTFFPTASTKLLYSECSVSGTDKVDATEFEGFNLAGSYALAPYMVVVNEESDTDDLFVWHRNKMKDSEDNVYSIDKTVNSYNRQLFADITGITLKSQKGYVLQHYVLYKTESNGRNPNGMTYASIRSHTPSGDQTITMGWLWTPPEFTTVTEGLDKYAMSLGDDKSCVLPIFAYKATSASNPKYYDANVNVAAGSSGSDYFSVGVMPYYVGTSDASKEKKYCYITKSGGYSYKDAGESTKDYVLYTAPTNIFAQLKGMGKKKVGELTAGTIYFGTSKCSIKNGKVLLSGRSTNFKADSEAVCTYLSNGNASVYSVTDAKTNIGDILKEIDTKIAYAMNDPENLVDWGQYKFKRIVMNLDAWSTVLLIFILNILPRVAILSFFVVMLLSLIKDWRAWQRFCHNKFDIYSFVSLGHLTVDTVDTKRLCFTSVICIGIFIMIMDGQIINFILFITKLLVAVYQR